MKSLFKSCRKPESMNYCIAHEKNVCYDKSTHNMCAIWLFKENPAKYRIYRNKESGCLAGRGEWKNGGDDTADCGAGRGIQGDCGQSVESSGKDCSGGGGEGMEDCG